MSLSPTTRPMTVLQHHRLGVQYTGHGELATACRGKPHSFHSHCPAAVQRLNPWGKGVSIQAERLASSWLPGRPHFVLEPKAGVAKCPPDIAEPLFELRERQSRSFHELPSGLKMEVIQQAANPNPQSNSIGRPPIVFLHGSYHAAWCWAVHWLPFFASLGYNCFALSLLGQGESDTPASGAGGTLQSHARDVAHFIRHKASEPPVLVGHSFGGLIVQQYLAHIAELDLESPPLSTAEGWEEPYPMLAAAILACSVPPTGNGPLVQRYLMSKPIASIKVTLSLAAKAFAYSQSLCKDTFFSRDMPSSLVQVYQKQLARSSNVPLFNLLELSASLPVGRPAGHVPPILVIGAENDFVVDMQGLHDTAAVYGNNLVVLPSIAHDIMLDTAWKDAAEVVGSWLKEKAL